MTEYEPTDYENKLADIKQTFTLIRKLTKFVLIGQNVDNAANLNQQSQ